VVDIAGKPLPPFEPGSHIDLYLPDRRLGVRQYSLCGDPQDRQCYTFAVQREPEGKGGSKAIFDRVRVGSVLTISEPRNNFPLRTWARRHLLLAGGIGITPIISMLLHLRRVGADFTIHYCTRSRERTAFADKLQPLVAENRAFIHWDGGNPSKGLDVKGLLRNYQVGTHLYFCGPAAFMKAVSTACAHWPSGTTHCEYFAAKTSDAVNGGRCLPEAGDIDDGNGVDFRVRLVTREETFDVPSDKSIVQVLREHGVDVSTSCELGLCGSCRTRYLEGEPDHRDFVLDELEQKNEIVICCSRSKSNLLVLDL